MSRICMYAAAALALIGAWPAYAASADCDARFPASNIKVAVARMQCFNNALESESEKTPGYPTADRDLLASFLAYRMAIAEQIQHGKITVLQGKALAAEKWSQMLSEDERRANERQAVQAQQAAIQARAAQAAEANRQAMYRQMVVTGARMMQGPPVIVQPQPAAPWGLPANPEEAFALGRCSARPNGC